MPSGTGWRRRIGWLIFNRHFPQKSPISSGSFAENDLQLKTSYECLPPCTLAEDSCTGLFYSSLFHVSFQVYLWGFHRSLHRSLLKSLWGFLTGPFKVPFAGVCLYRAFHRSLCKSFYWSLYSSFDRSLLEVALIGFFSCMQVSFDNNEYSKGVRAGVALWLQIICVRSNL